MALKAGYYGLKRSLLNKVKALPVIKSIGAGLSLNSTTGELEATGATISIEANPEAAATENLVKLGLGENVYAVPDAAKTYQTDDATESAIVDADYIPFLDSSAASGSGAPKKSTWPNFISKIKAKITEYVTWEAQSVLGAKNFNNGESEFTFIKSTERTHLFHIDKDLKVGDKISVIFNISDVSGFITSNKFIARIGGNPVLSPDVVVDVTQSKVRLEFTITTASQKTQANNAVYMFIVSDEADAATLKVSNVMVVLASDSDDVYQPYAMTNRELTETKLQYVKELATTDDINNITQPGFYGIGSGAVNTPENITYAILLHIHGAGTNEQQYVIKGSAGVIYTRSLSSVSPRTWGNWMKFQGAVVS